MLPGIPGGSPGKGPSVLRNGAIFNGPVSNGLNLQGDNHAADRKQGSAA